VKIYGAKDFFVQLAVLAAIFVIGIVNICRGELGCIAFVLIPLIYAGKNFPAHFNSEEYEKMRRREACFKVAYRSAFGRWMWAARWGFIVFFAAALVCLLVSTSLPWLVTALGLLVLSIVYIAIVERIAKKHLTSEYYENL